MLSGPAAAGARRRPLRRDADAAQHHGTDHEPAGIALRHGEQRRRVRSRTPLPCRRRSSRFRRRRAGDQLAGGRAGRGLQHQLGAGGGREGRRCERPAQDDKLVSGRALRVLQATLAQLDGSFSLPVAVLADALPSAGSNAAVFTRWPCNRSSPVRCRACAASSRPIPSSAWSRRCPKAVACATRRCGPKGAMRCRPTSMPATARQLFPRRAPRTARAAATALTAHHRRHAGSRFRLCRRRARDAMLDGLVAFVEGRIARKFWSPAFAKSADLDVRKIAALEGLSRHGRAQPKMLAPSTSRPTCGRRRR